MELAPLSKTKEVYVIDTSSLIAMTETYPQDFFPGVWGKPEPPAETLPVANFRRMAHARPDQPSSNLLDTLYLCQQWRKWYRDY